MTYPENNKKNRQELAANIVSTYDTEDLREYIIRAMVNDYRDHPNDFKEVWNDFKNDFEWSEELRESMKKDCPNPGCHCGACEKKDSDIEAWQIEDALYGRR